MKIVRPVIAAAVGVSLVLAGSAGAATAPKPKVLELTDAKGDANALNGQSAVSGSGDPVPVSADGNVTPVGSQDNKDVVSVKWASTLKKAGKKYTCTGFTATLTLVGTPGADTSYRLIGTGPVNTSNWWLQYDGIRSVIRHSSGTATTVDLLTPVVIAGSTITFTVTDKDISGTGEKLKSFVLSGAGVDIRTSAKGLLTAPLWDQIVETDKTFKPC